MAGSLAVLSGAARALASARTLNDVGEIHDIAAAAATYAKAHELGIESENYAVEIRLRAARKGGQLLARMEGQRAKVGRPEKNGGDSPPILADIGIDKDRAKEFRMAAKPSEREFRGYIERTQASAARLTMSGLTRVANGMAPHYTSDTPEWRTPPEIIAAAVAALGAIDLDPCSNDGEPNVPARHHYTAKEDGLSKAWPGRVYMNPPYGSAIADWVAKLCEEHKAGRTRSAVALVPARTDTEWWSMLRDSVICFVRGRLRFSGSDTSAPFPSAVAYLGDDTERFARAFRETGDIWRRIR